PQPSTCTFELNEQLEIDSLIDVESFLRALAGGRFDACLDYLEQEPSDREIVAGLYCRLAEALLHRDRPDDAVECCRRASPWVGSDAAALRLCAWVFSNTRCHDEAAASYRRLAEICPEPAEFYRHASGSLAAAGRIEEAIADGTSASDLAPQHCEFALHAG